VDGVRIGAVLVFTDHYDLAVGPQEVARPHAPSDRESVQAFGVAAGIRRQVLREYGDQARNDPLG
jgi:hypothetical protein